MVQWRHIVTLIWLNIGPVNSLLPHASRHYVIQYQFNTQYVLWHSSESNFTTNAHELYLQHFGRFFLKLWTHLVETNELSIYRETAKHPRTVLSRGILVVALHSYHILKWIWKSIIFFKCPSDENIERHTAVTIASWPNPKQWVIVHTSDMMMIIRQSIYILSIITREMGKLKTYSPTYCIMDNGENMLNLTHTLDKIYLTGIL